MLDLKTGIEQAKKAAEQRRPQWRKVIEAAKTGEPVKKNGSVITRVLDCDPVAGQISYHHYDLMSDVVVIEEVQDLEPFMEWTSQVRKTDYAAKGIKNEFMHAARIPFNIIDKWKKEGLNVFSKDERDQKEVNKRLNSAEYRYLRTGNQKL